MTLERRASAVARPVAATLTMLCCAVGAPALAQAPAAAEPEKPLRGFVSIGVTRGGDTLAVVGYVGINETTDIRAGGQVDLRVGADLRLGDSPFSVQGGIGYFGQSANGIDGSVKFERYPIEVLGYWQASERLRVGGGVRRVGKGKLDGNGVAQGLGTITFKGKVGYVVEGEWAASRTFGFGLRYVGEEYTAPNGEKVDGSHFGLRLNIYF